MKRVPPRFNVGDVVKVKRENPAGNPRTPDHIKGKKGVIIAVHGEIKNPRDHRRIYPALYTIVASVGEVFGTPSTDKLYIDVHDDWLDAA